MIQTAPATHTFNAEIESPLIPHLMHVERGICHGHEEIRPFFREVGRRKPSLRKYYRTGYFTDGKKLIWEYPRARSRMANRWTLWSQSH